MQQETRAWLKQVFADEVGSKEKDDATFCWRTDSHEWMSRQRVRLLRCVLCVMDVAKTCFALQPSPWFPQA